MPQKFITNKPFLLILGLIALFGIIFISFSATQTNNAPLPAKTSPIIQAKTAPMPTSTPDKPVPGQLIVKFKPQYTDAQITAYLKQYHAHIIKKIEGINQTVISVPTGQEKTLEQQMKSDSYVEETQQDYTTHAFFTPNDSGFAMQYALKNTGQAIQGNSGKAHSDINAQAAWDVTQGNGIKVAILDTGINLNHPDLAGKVIAQKSFVSATVEDGSGHGTHVAGIIAADTNNTEGIAGTCPGCQLLIGKVLDDTGTGTTSDATAGITWAADQGAKVINMSLGTNELQTATLYNQAIAYAMQKGAIVIAAAGNDGISTISYPAAATGVISVAATDNKDAKPSWSDYGTWVAVAAPGKDILSTAPTHTFHIAPFGYDTAVPYMYLSGTSMATPYVSGVAALVASTQYGGTPQQIANRLFATADKIAGTGTLWTYGRINAAQAVGTAPSTTAPSPSVITPTVYCVGGAGVPPCATISSGAPQISFAPSGVAPSTTSIIPVTSGTTSPNPSISSAPESNASPSPVISGAPQSGGTQLCSNLKSIFYNLTPSKPKTNGKIHSKCHSGNEKGSNPNNGGLSKFIELLLKWLQQLLQLLQQCLPQSPSTGAPNPSVAPVISTAPSGAPSASPATSSPSAAISAPITQPSAVPWGTQSNAEPLPPGNWKLAWSDDFNGTAIDWNKWQPTSAAEADCGRGDQYNYNNGQAEWAQADNPANASVAGGIATITALKQTVTGCGHTYSWTSGRLQSKQAFGAGTYISMRFKLGGTDATGSDYKGGTWDGFWTWCASGANGCEVDGYEAWPPTNNNFSLTSHLSTGGGSTNAAVPDITAWHIMGMQLGATSTTWYLDGQKVFQTNGGLPQNVNLIIDQDVCNGKGCPVPGPSATKAQLQIDYVHIWQ